MKKKLDIAFVILHYMNSKVTIECVMSILKTQTNYKYKIFIVDNGSNNDSDVEIKEYFKDNDTIVIIKSEKNLGFSKGNNLGINFIKRLYEFEFLCVLNNDTLIETRNIYKILKNKVNGKEIHVIGTKVWNVEKKMNHNYFYSIANIEEAREELKKIKIRYYFSKVNLYILFIFLDKLKKFLKLQEKNLKEKNKNFHGSALIFTKAYCDKYRDVFIEKTFLYYEEDFLNFRVLKDNLEKLYIEEILILHKESVSTKQLLKTRNKKWKFQLYYMFFAIKELVKLYENSDKNV